MNRPAGWRGGLTREPSSNHKSKWNNQSKISCVLCQAPLETRDHLFFSVTTQRKSRMSSCGIMKSNYSYRRRGIKEDMVNRHHQYKGSQQPLIKISGTASVCYAHGKSKI
uniref:Uncharacterized protein n=1 Tax=Brassica oleracea TaxID=3712 RepID=A0A3P6H1P1_BRAOL|nr:unnamed protein product [Brassica oleracea]